MTMGLEPLIELMQTASSATGGDVCLPWPVVFGVPGAMASAIVYLIKRNATLTDRTEARYDSLLEEFRRTGSD